MGRSESSRSDGRSEKRRVSARIWKSRLSKPISTAFGAAVVPEVNAISAVPGVGLMDLDTGASGNGSGSGTFIRESSRHSASPTVAPSSTSPFTTSKEDWEANRIPGRTLYRVLPSASRSREVSRGTSTLRDAMVASATMPQAGLDSERMAMLSPPSGKRAVSQAATPLTRWASST
jgi:hypothetical protein